MHLIGENEGSRPEIILGDREPREELAAEMAAARMRGEGRSVVYFSNEKDGAFPAVAKEAERLGYEVKELWIPVSTDTLCADPIRYVTSRAAACRLAEELARGTGKGGGQRGPEAALLASGILYVMETSPRDDWTVRTTRGILSLSTGTLDTIAERERGLFPAARAEEYLRSDEARKEAARRRLLEDLESYLPFIGDGGGEVLDFAALRKGWTLCHVHAYAPTRAAGKIAGAFLAAAVTSLLEAEGKPVDIYLQADGLLSGNRSMSWLPEAGAIRGVSTTVMAGTADEVSEAFTSEAAKFLAANGSVVMAAGGRAGIRAGAAV